MSVVVIETARRSDASELIRANSESQAHHAPWVQPFCDAEGFESWFSRQSAGTDVHLVARDAGTHGIVGIVSFSQISLGIFLSACLGYYGMVRFSRQGLMTKAVQAAVAYGFSELGLHRLEANIQPENLASIALVRRAGFHLEGFSPRYLRIGGIWRDHERWAILADEPASGRRDAGSHADIRPEPPAQEPVRRSGIEDADPPGQHR